MGILARFPSSVGPPGIPGTNGSNGINGSPGSVWYDGEGPPTGVTANVGDMYLDLTNGDVYKMSGSGWGTAVGNIKGLTGPTGPQGPPGPGGTISYHNPLGASADHFDIDIDASFRTFRLRMRTVVIGSGFNPPAAGEGVITVLRVNGANVPHDGTLMGAVSVVDASVAGNAVEDNPYSVDLISVGGLIYDCTRPGDIFEVILECDFLAHSPDTFSVQSIEMSSRIISPSRGNRTGFIKGFFAIPTNPAIAQLGLGFWATGADPQPLFDVNQTLYAITGRTY